MTELELNLISKNNIIFLQKANAIKTEDQIKTSYFNLPTLNKICNSRLFCV